MIVVLVNSIIAEHCMYCTVFIITVPPKVVKKWNHMNISFKNIFPNSWDMYTVLHVGWVIWLLKIAESYNWCITSEA